MASMHELIRLEADGKETFLNLGNVFSVEIAEQADGEGPLARVVHTPPGPGEASAYQEFHGETAIALRDELRERAGYRDPHTAGKTGFGRQGA